LPPAVPGEGADPPFSPPAKDSAGAREGDASTASAVFPAAAFFAAEELPLFAFAAEAGFPASRAFARFSFGGAVFLGVRADGAAPEGEGFAALLAAFFFAVLSEDA
jgi:hypothetical protein